MLSKTLTAAAGIIIAAAATSCTAHAEPVKFPDISGYTPVNPQDYAIDTSSPGIPSTGTYFLTPDGVICGFTPGLGAGCTGNNLPGIPAATGWHMNEVATGRPPRQTTVPIGTNGTVHGNPVETLPPFHSIDVTGIICGVDDAHMTACKDPQGRGFILSPAWSGWLPHA